MNTPTHRPIFLVLLDGSPCGVACQSEQEAYDLSRQRSVTRGVYTQTGLAYESNARTVKAWETRRAVDLGFMGARKCFVRYQRAENALGLPEVTLLSVWNHDLQADLLRYADAGSRAVLQLAIEVELGEMEIAA